MEVTDVRIRKIHPSAESTGKMRAIVSVTFDNEFVVHDIKVIQGDEKFFIAMPSRKMEDGTYKDITHPIKSGLRNKIQDAVLSRYEQALAEADAAKETAAPAEAQVEVPAEAQAEQAEQAAQTEAQTEQAAQTEAQTEQAAQTEAQAEQAAQTEAQAEQAAQTEAQTEQAAQTEAQAEQG